MPIRWRRYGGGLLSIAGLLLGLALSEVVLRFFPVAGQVYRTAPGHLFEYVPRSEKIFVHQLQNRAEFVRVSINSDGFRGPEFDTNGDALRVVVYGDSFIAAEFSPLEETFCTHLRESLSARGIRAEVINAGVVGYGPDQIALRIGRDALELRPDLVILAVFAGNDFGDLIRNKLFRLAGDRTSEQRSVRLSPELADEFESTGLRQLAVGRLIRRSVISIPRRLHALAGSAGAPVDPGSAGVSPDLFGVQLAINELEFDDYSENPLEVSNLFHDAYDADVSLRPSSLSARYKVRLMRAVMRKIRSELTARSARSLVVAIPAPHDLIDRYDGFTVDPDRYPDYRRSRLTDEVVAAASLAGFSVVDLFPVFESSEPERLYFHRGENHWNELGQALGAQVVAEALTRLVPPDGV